MLEDFLFSRNLARFWMHQKLPSRFQILFRSRQWYFCHFEQLIRFVQPASTIFIHKNKQTKFEPRLQDNKFLEKALFERVLLILLLQYLALSSCREAGKRDRWFLPWYQTRYLWSKRRSKLRAGSCRVGRASRYALKEILQTARILSSYLIPASSNMEIAARMMTAPRHAAGM